jgi:hypothetical protein
MDENKRKWLANIRHMQLLTLTTAQFLELCGCLYDVAYQTGRLDGGNDAFDQARKLIRETAIPRQAL